MKLVMLLEILKRARLTLFLSDMNIASRFGMEILQKVTSDYPGTGGVIIMSGSIDDNEAEELLSKGAQALIYKPFGPDELREAVGKYSDLADKP